MTENDFSDPEFTPCAVEYRFVYLTGPQQWNNLSAVDTLLSRHSAQQEVMLEECGFAEVWGDRYRGKQ